MMMMMNDGWVNEYEIQLLITTHLVLLYPSLSFILKQVLFHVFCQNPATFLVNLHTLFLGPIHPLFPGVVFG